MSKTCQVGVWGKPRGQKISSAKTAGKRVAALLKKAKLGPRNADIGGGPYELGTQALRARGVKNLVFDPHNRGVDENERAVRQICGGQADTATVANVLNVIREPAVRQQVLRQAADAVGCAGDKPVYIAVHHDPKQKAGPTPFGWQEQRPLKSYLPEVEKVFKKVELKGDMIVARAPRACKVRR